MPGSILRPLLLAATVTASASLLSSPIIPELIESDKVVRLQNDRVCLEFDLDRGTYRIRHRGDARPAIASAHLKIDAWATNAPGTRNSWSGRKVRDALGNGLALDLTAVPENGPELYFSFILYEGSDFFSARAGVRNTTGEVLRVRDIHVLADGAIYPESAGFKDFAMIDGFSGGEPLEYGERLYSPLTRANASKSRNNLFLTFSEANQRKQVLLGGLSYHDFEKFAWIEQARRAELARGSDGEESLLAYLNLPTEREDRAPGGERLELLKGEALRRWENHQFRCTELATSVKEPGEIIIQAANLDGDRPYRLGFSWWQGLRHGNREDLTQSVFVEYRKKGESRRIPLVENRRLPRFDGRRKEDVEQVELPLPAEAVAAGNLRLIIEKAEGTESEDRHVYLNEVWLRDGRKASLLPGEWTPVANSPRPRRSYTAQLFASDPVGKRLDPGQSYTPADRFYIDVTGSDPFQALEDYAHRVRKAQNIQLSMYDFPTVCLWYAADKRYGGVGKDGADNTSLGAVEEARDIADSGFLNYSRVAVRLVPDSYMPDNQQGWWDDKHWQREDTDRDATENGRYVEPYETTEKWGRAVTDLGVIPLTYFQAGYRSEDYAARFPEHMLFNKRYAWKGQPVDTESEMFTAWQTTWTRNGRVVWSYDYTDPGFIAHLHRVYANLRSGGVQGLMFDYPATAWAKAGGMEDDYTTTAAAYRTVFRLPHELLGPESFVHERNMERGTDVSLGVVASMRTENDTDSFDLATATRCGLRWYKNRVLVNFDTDSKNLLKLSKNRDHLRAVLTMCYVTSSRLLLANSFGQFSEENLWDLSRTFPYHRTPKSARPVDAFVSEMPLVYSYDVSPTWHQVTFYNPDKENSQTIGINLSGPQVDGALGLEPDAEVHVYDFWNDQYIGKLNGRARLEQSLRPGEARMMSVRSVKTHPQVISTNRHIMQGYLDLRDVKWEGGRKILSGVSRIVKDDPYRVVLAMNGHSAVNIQVKDLNIQSRLAPRENGLVEFVLESPENTEAEWSISFE